MGRAASSGLDGISVRHYPDNPDHQAKPWLARAKDEGGRWKTKWHADESAATKWAVGLSRQFAKGTTAGKVRMSVIGPAYVSRLTSRERSAGYIDQVDSVWKAMVRADLDEVNRPDFGARFERWVGRLPGDWWVTPEERAAPTKQVLRALKRATSKTATSAARKDAVVRTARAIIHRMAMMTSPPLLTHDPLRGVEAFRDSRDKTIRHPFTVEEVQTMVGDGMRDHPFWLPVCLMAYNPRRTAEAMHLRWEWINWAAMSCKLVMCPELERAGITFKSGETSWPLEPELADILRPLAKPHGWIIDNERIRSNGSTEAVCDRTQPARPVYTRAFARYMKAAGIEAKGRTVYCLRHTGITIRLAMGISENLVAAYAAHADSRVTLGSYGRERAQFSHRVKEWGTRLYFRDEEPVALAKAR